MKGRGIRPADHGDSGEARKSGKQSRSAWRLSFALKDEAREDELPLDELFAEALRPSAA